MQATAGHSARHILEISDLRIRLRRRTILLSFPRLRRPGAIGRPLMLRSKFVLLLKRILIRGCWRHLGRGFPLRRKAVGMLPLHLYSYLKFHPPMLYLIRGRWRLLGWGDPLRRKAVGMLPLHRSGLRWFSNHGPLLFRDGKSSMRASHGRTHRPTPPGGWSLRIRRSRFPTSPSRSPARTWTSPLL